MNLIWLSLQQLDCLMKDFLTALNEVCLMNERIKSSQSYIMTDGQLASLSWNKAPIWGLQPDLYYCQTVAGLLMWGTLSDDWTGLSFTTAAGPCQHSHSRVRVPSDHILLSQIRDFHFRHLLRLAGLWWRYSTLPSYGENEWKVFTAPYIGYLVSMDSPLSQICCHEKFLLKCSLLSNWRSIVDCIGNVFT
jgi:hypothetical protein